MNHPDHHLLDRYALGQLTDAGQLGRVEEHLLVCERCRQQVELADEIKHTLLETVCPPDEAIAVYREGKCSPAFAAAMQRHLSTCEHCRRRLDDMPSAN
jgi:anti-sigma factor ChrR (cupin superfamily)